MATSGYLHGVYVSEEPTSFVVPVSAEAGLPFFVGAAPVCLGDRTNVNKPVLCTSYEDFVTELGYRGQASNDAYSLCRAAEVYFGLYNVQPAVFLNVLDPDDPSHMDAVARAPYTWASGQTSKTLSVHGVDHDTLILDDGAMVPTPYVVDTDYTLAYDDDGYTVITRVATGAMGTGALPACHLTYDRMDPSGVDTADIIGSVTGGGVAKGLYCIEDVYPRHQKVPAMIGCPGYSHEPTVKAAMVARGASINGCFVALSVVDAEADGYDVADYADVSSWKTTNGYTDDNLVVCWPKVLYGTDVHELSIHFLGLANQVDAGKGQGVPYVSPSNNTLKINGTVLYDGTTQVEVFLTQPQANVLNGQGVVTALNWSGWRLWGSNCAGYPTQTDPKDRWIPIRRMNNWLTNTLILTYFGTLDSPLTRRLIDSVVDSVNIYLNGLKAQGSIIAGSCVFRQADNPTSDLLNGRAKFRVYWTPPPPAEAITFVLEYDATAFASLFA